MHQLTDLPPPQFDLFPRVTGVNIMQILATVVAQIVTHAHRHFLHAQTY